MTNLKCNQILNNTVERRGTSGRGRGRGRGRAPGGRGSAPGGRGRGGRGRGRGQSSGNAVGGSQDAANEQPIAAASQQETLRGRSKRTAPSTMVTGR